jgi:hypothetical protein
MADSYMRVTNGNYDAVTIPDVEKRAQASPDWIKDFMDGAQLPPSAGACFSGHAELPVLKIQVEGELPGEIDSDRAIVRASDRFEQPQRRPHAAGEIPQVFHPVNGGLPKVQPIEWGNPDEEMLEIAPLKFGRPMLRKLY